MKPVQVRGLIALGGVAATLWAVSFLISALRATPAPWIILGASLHSMLAFWAFTWAVSRSNRAFFSMFAGDAVLRLAALGLLTVLILQAGWPPVAPLLSLAAVYAVMSLAQIPFLMRVR